MSKRDAIDMGNVSGISELCDGYIVKVVNQS
jgi:hypothetical protein